MKKVFLFLFLLVLMVNCGGGGGGGNNNQPPPPPPPPPPPTPFTPSQCLNNCSYENTIQANTQARIYEGSCNLENVVFVIFSKDQGNLIMAIYLNSLNNIFGYSFYLAYDPNQLQFVEYKKGNFFDANDETDYALKEVNTSEGAAGKNFCACEGKTLLIGHSKIGYTLTGNSGHEMLLGWIKFKIISGNNTTFLFSNVKMYIKNSSDDLGETSFCFPKKIILNY